MEVLIIVKKDKSEIKQAVLNLLTRHSFILSYLSDSLVNSLATYLFIPEHNIYQETVCFDSCKVSQLQHCCNTCHKIPNAMVGILLSINYKRERECGCSPKVKMCGSNVFG